MVAQAAVYSYLFFIYPNAKGLGDNLPGINAIAAVPVYVSFEPRPPSPEQITANCGSRTIDDPKRKEFLETNLKRKFFNWAASSWDFSMLTLAAL
jgi:hypothetical protein